MLRFKDLRKLRKAEQHMHSKSWWAMHLAGSVGLLAAGYILGKKRH